MNKITYYHGAIDRQNTGNSLNAIDRWRTGDVKTLLGGVGMNLIDSTVLIASGLLTDSAQEFVVMIVCHDEAIKHSRSNGSFSQTSILFFARSNLEVSKNRTCHRAPKFVLLLSRFDLKARKMK